MNFRIASTSALYAALYRKFTWLLEELKLGNYEYVNRAVDTRCPFCLNVEYLCRKCQIEPLLCGDVSRTFIKEINYMLGMMKYQNVISIIDQTLPLIKEWGHVA